VDEIQAKMTADLGLAVMVYCKLSQARYERLREMLSKRYCIEEDTYYRLKTVNGIEFPILPGRWAIDRFKAMLAEDHGYTVSDDGKSVTMNLTKQIANRLLDQGSEWLKKVGWRVVVQVLGDGYRHFRRMTVVNLCMRIALVHTHLANAVQNMMIMAIWEGHEDKSSIDEYTEEVREVMQVVGDGGVEIDLFDFDAGHYKGRVEVEWRGGGDMKWIATVMGVSGWLFSVWYLLKQKDFHATAAMNRQGKKAHLKTIADCHHLAHRFYRGEKQFKCPGCKKTFKSKREVKLDYQAEKYTVASFRACHYSHTFDLVPTFDIDPLHIYVCVCVALPPSHCRYAMEAFCAVAHIH
jgi:hypothetical protein